MRRMKFLFLTVLCSLTLSLPALGTEVGFAAPDDVGETDVPIDNGAEGIGVLTEPEENWPAPLSEAWMARHNCAPGRGTAEDLEKHWAMTGWPDDLSYVFEAGGMVEEGVVYTFWEVGLVDADDARRAEVLDLAAPTCLVTFFDCRYPYARREEVCREIQALNDPNIEQVLLGRNTQYVIVDVADGLDEDYQARLSEQYGDGLILVTDLITSLEETKQNDVRFFPGMGLDRGTLFLFNPAAPLTGGAAKGRPFFLPAAAGAGAVLMGLLLLSRRRTALLQTGQSQQTAPVPLTRAQVEQAVRADLRSPRPQTFAAIRERLEQEEQGMRS